MVNEDADGNIAAQLLLDGESLTDELDSRNSFIRAGSDGKKTVQESGSSMLSSA